MSLHPSVLDALLEAGATAEMIVAAVKAEANLEAELTERRRAKDRHRQRRHRERNSRTSHGMSRDVTVTPRDTPPNDIDILTPDGSEPVGSSNHKRAKFSAPDGVSENVWGDFLKSPKRRKAGMSETAYAGIVRNLTVLAEHGYPPGEMIALAVERGWITVKLEWVQNDGRKYPNNITSLRGHRPDPALDLLRAASAAEDRENSWRAGSSVPAIGSG